jgi:hypothetical protein
MADNPLPTSPSKRVTDFLEKVRVQASQRGRLIFVVDATGSRKDAWDASARLQMQMFEEAGKIGGLEIQLVYFRGESGFGGECKASPWVSDGHELARLMARITCQTGHTQYQKAFEHVRMQHRMQPINAVVVVGDMCEEERHRLYEAVGGLGVPCFLFQEGDDMNAAEIFREIALLTKGAYSQFRPGAERELAELLRAVAAFATGGLTALADQRTDSARKLLGQMK